jgi:hypothetical protein
VKTIFGLSRPIHDVVARAVDEINTAHGAPIPDVTRDQIVDNISRTLIRSYHVMTISGESFALVPVTTRPLDPVAVAV